jgi:hypothetical protein
MSAAALRRHALQHHRNLIVSDLKSGRVNGLRSIEIVKDESIKQKMKHLKS